MSELRQDLMSGDWVLIAPGRAARPKFLDKKKSARKPSPKSTCPFEDLKKSGNWPPILALPHESDWKIAVIPNKYPALERGSVCSVPFRQGIYHARTAVGTHRLIITRDHNKHFADLSPAEATKVFAVFHALHKRAAQDECAAYISSFYNYGQDAGASVWHPHYQALTLPIIPPHNARSLRGTADYFKKFGRCVRCDVIKVERKKKVRVIAENEHAIALAPYASKRPFEVNVMPKKHWASFRETPPAAVRDVALALQSVVQKMKKYVNDPDLNFFIHDTPLDHKDYRHHHWHIEVIPKTSLEAGFEFSTRIDINVVDPDNAAAILRGKRERFPQRTSMIKNIAKYRLVSLLSLASFAFAAGGFFWALGALADISSGPLILHFNDMQGITSIGGFGGLVLMGILGIAIVVVNFFVALSLEARDRVLGKIVAAMTLVMAILLFLAFAAIIRVN